MPGDHPDCPLRDNTEDDSDHEERKEDVMDRLKKNKEELEELKARRKFIDDRLTEAQDLDVEDLERYYLDKLIKLDNEEIPEKKLDVEDLEEELDEVLDEKRKGKGKEVIKPKKGRGKQVTFVEQNKRDDDDDENNGSGGYSW
jgi:hypothetical protein